MPLLKASVEKHIAKEDRYKLQNDAGWLIRFSGTTVELSNALEITGPAPATPIGSTVVVLMSGYYGRGPTDMWEWLKTRFES